MTIPDADGREISSDEEWARLANAPPPEPTRWQRFKL